ncbi:MAG: IPT/TIG domain-containing protein [bacterium]|nr:IPT/TIG domain-containing protein [bacterium]
MVASSPRGRVSSSGTCLLLLGLAACTSVATAPVTGPVARLDTVPAGKHSVSEGLRGSIRMRFRWPARTPQGLLRKASSIRVVLSDIQGVSVADRVVDRVDDTEVTLSFPDLRPGRYRLSVEARDGRLDLVASGGTELVVRANEVSAAVLTLRRPVTEPVVTGVNPDHGLPGTTVLISGNGFGEAARGPVGVRVGAVAVPAGDVVFRSDSQVIFRVPPAATTSAITLSVLDRELTALSRFTTLASLSVTPLGRPLAPRERSFFFYEARDSEGNVFSGARIPWQVLDWRCIGCPPGDNDVLSVDDRGNVSAEPDLIEGYATVQAGIPPLAVRVTVEVQSGF